MGGRGGVNQRLQGRQQACHKVPQQVPRLPAAGLSVPNAKPHTSKRSHSLADACPCTGDSTEAQQICKQRTRYTSLRSVQGMRLPSSLTW